MKKLMTMVLGVTLLSVPAMFAASKKGGTSGKEKEKNPTAAKAAKAAKAKTQSAAEQKVQRDCPTLR